LADRLDVVDIALGAVAVDVVPEGTGSEVRGLLVQRPGRDTVALTSGPMAGLAVQLEHLLAGGMVR